MKVATAMGMLILVIMIVGCQKDQEQTVVIKQVEPETTCVIIEILPFSYVCLSFQSVFQDYRAAIDTFRAVASRQGFELADTMLAVHYHLPDQKLDSASWEIGFVVPESLVVMEPLSVKKWNFNKVVQASYRGPADKMDTIYPHVSKFMKSHRLTAAGQVVERFPANPSSNDPNAFAAEIWFAIKSD